MSIIYSAGQFDDAFCPRKLGNWEAGAKEACPYTKLRQFNPATSRTQVIVDSRGHLLPWIPRDKSKTWGLLSYYMNSKYAKSIRQTMAMMSGPGRQCPSSATIKRFKKLPKFSNSKRQENSTGDEDILLEYLQDLCLPIVWIIGPPTKNTNQKRKLFAKQLASKLGFGYVNLDEKIQEWKDRQTTCTCIHPHTGRSNCNTATSAHSLASTSIAPSKLPTNVSPKISSELPAPPDRNDGNTYSLTMLDSQRISFDTALPIERNKILELYKFAMAECLPCGGFILDSVPFDLVEGLAFEKVFYPAALAIYFTEGIPPKKNVKPKDRRVTATTASLASDSKFLRNPKDEKGKKLQENQYMKMRSHKRLGNFSPMEGEKICKQFGSKTIRIINAEDVEKDTMDFLNELVKRNLEKYEQIVNGGSDIDIEQDGNILSISSEHAPASSNYSDFISEGRELDEEDVFEDEERKALEEIKKLIKKPEFGEENKEFVIGPSSRVGNMPPALITANHSESSLMTLPNFPNDPTASSMSSSAMQEENSDIEEVGGAGDGLLVTRQGSPELWEKIMKLETKVAELNPEEEDIQLEALSPIKRQCEIKEVEEIPLPPPTAYAEQEEDNRLTTAIRNAMVPNFVSQECLLPKLRSTPPPPPEFDYGACGDCGGMKASRPPSDNKKNHYFPFGKPPSQGSSDSERNPQSRIASRKQSSNKSSQEEDSFYD